MSWPSMVTRILSLKRVCRKCGHDGLVVESEEYDDIDGMTRRLVCKKCESVFEETWVLIGLKEVRD